MEEGKAVIFLVCQYNRALHVEVRCDRKLSKVVLGQGPAPVHCQSTLLFSTD